MGLGLALGAFLKCLCNRDFAQEVKGIALARKGASTEADSQPQVSEQPVHHNDSNVKESVEGSHEQELYPWGAVHVLAELQKEGRLIDFLEEDLSEYEDDEIGSSVRTIHEGCKRALEKICDREKVVDQEEESAVRVNRDYDANAMKLTGRVSDMFPLKGQLVHPGWKVTEMRLPVRPEGARPVLAPAEVEIG